MRVVVLLSVLAGAFALEISRECPENSHYKACGTACPLTCDNYANPPKYCILLCKPGCQCDEGYVKDSNGECVEPEECPQQAPQDVYQIIDQADEGICALPKKEGTCRGFFPRFHFDSKSGTCRRFIYGGCGGNGNNFKTESECKKTCGAKAESCGENQSYTTCGTACPLTCDNYQNPPKACTLQCVVGCECEKGYVKTKKGQCVLPEQCPTGTRSKRG